MKGHLILKAPSVALSCQYHGQIPEAFLNYPQILIHDKTLGKAFGTSLNAAGAFR